VKDARCINVLTLVYAFVCSFCLHHQSGMRLLYQASRDGFGAGDFFSRCSERGPTLTIIKVRQREGNSASIHADVPDACDANYATIEHC
jgi:hypothetical protein